MTTDVEDRRRRRGGVLVVLVLAIIAAWLVYLWLDGIGGDGEVTADRPVATTATTAAPATTTTTVEATTTTIAPATTTTTRPAALGVIDSTIVDYGPRLESIEGEKARLDGLFAPNGRSAFGLTRLEGGDVLLLARLGEDPDGDALVRACGEAFGRACKVVVEAGTPVPWLDGVVASLAELDNVPGLRIGVVDGEYTLLGQAVSDEAKDRIGASVAAVIGPELTLVNELEVVEAEVITGGTQTALEDLDLPGITFESGSADITPEGQAILDDAIEVLTNAVGVAVEVGGHTDSAGGAASNQRLSQARAESVVAYLVDGGVDAAILTAVGSGEEQPIADNATPEGREQNRRIEFTVSAV